MKCKLCVLFFIFLIGCSKVDEPAKDNDSQSNFIDKEAQTKETVIPDKNDLAEKSNDTEEGKKLSYMREDGKVMSAEEQMRQYYAEKGLKYPDSSTTDNSTKSETGVIAPEAQLKQYYADKGLEYPDSSTTEKYTVDDPLFYSTPSSQTQQEVEQTNHDYAEEDELTPQRTSVRKPPSQKVIDQLNASINDDVEETESQTQPEYSDSEPPELVSIRFVPNELLPGEEAEVFAQAIDNLSGVKSIFGVMKSPSENAMVSFSCALLNTDGTFKGVVKIPEHAEAGQWYLRSVRVTDNVFNTQNYSKNHPILNSSYITITESDSDITAPELISIFIDPPQAYGKDTVTVMVDATDNKSGVYRVYGLLASPSMNAKLSFACQYSAELNIFEGTVIIPSSAESGYWQVQYLRLEDTAKNAKTYYKHKNEEIFRTAKVEVITEGSDSEPPVLEDIYITPPTVVYEEAIKIHVKVSDDVSGVASVNGRIKSPSGQAFMPFYCKYNEEEGEFIAEIIIQRNTEVGVWQLDNLVLSDKARNQNRMVRMQDPIIQQADFEVLGE